MSIEYPIRYPHSLTAQGMTKRAWWLLALGIVLPGAPQVLAGNRRLGRLGLLSTALLWSLLIGAVVAYTVRPELLFSLLTRSWSLLVIQGVLLAYAVLWLVLTLNTMVLLKLVRVQRNMRLLLGMLATVTMALSVSMPAYAAFLVQSQRGLVSTVFVQAKPVDPIDGRYNILLIGADAGEDRDGIRPDSMTVVSVDATTGQAVMVGVPRDLCGFDLPESSPLYEYYLYNSDGLFDCKANGVFNVVEAFYDEVYPDAVAQGSRPGIEATKDAVEGITGIPIQYYVMVDMAGFASMIDALGGVTVDVQDRIPLVAYGFEGEVPEWIEPGVQTLDGQRALWFARSRFDSSDWDRMERQRQLQLAIFQQFTPGNLLKKFQGISQAGSAIVTTDIPESMLGFFVSLALKTKEQEIVRINLVPPEFDPDNPDIAYIHDYLAGVLHPAPAAQ